MTRLRRTDSKLVSKARQIVAEITDLKQLTEPVRARPKTW